MMLVKKILKGLGLIIGLLVIITAIGFKLMFREIPLPQPKGKYPVGITYRTIQTDRTADFHAFVETDRTIHLKIWYPATLPENEPLQPALYIEGGKEAVKKAFPDPSFIIRLGLHQAVKLKTNAWLEIPMAAGQFPVITYSHQYGGWPGDNSSLAEHLASKGFIVVAISHLHQALFASINQDSILQSKTIALFDTIDRPFFKQQHEERMAIQSQAELDKWILARRSYTQSRDRYCHIWTDDIVSTIDYIKYVAGKEDDFFYQKMDTSKIGATGFSFGGNAAINATLKVPSIRAAINMDGAVDGDFFTQKPDARILFMASTGAKEKALSYFANFRDKDNQPYPTLMFQAARHSNFCDLNFFPLAFKWLGFTGDIEAEFMDEQKNRIVHDFFAAAFNQVEFKVDQYTRDDRIIRYNYEQAYAVAE